MGVPEMISFFPKKGLAKPSALHPFPPLASSPVHPSTSNGDSKWGVHPPYSCWTAGDTATQRASSRQTRRAERAAVAAAASVTA